MVAGRVIGEAIIASVSAIILLVILGLRYISGAVAGSNSQSPAVQFATSSFFLSMLFVIIVGALVVIEIGYRVRDRHGRAYSKRPDFALITPSASAAPQLVAKTILIPAVTEGVDLDEMSCLGM